MGAGTETPGGKCDAVLACAGDVPTMETLAAAMIIRERCPNLKIRVVNVVDLMMMSAPGAGVCRHDHAMPEDKFEELFGTDCPVIMFFHGSPSTVRGLIYRRRSSSNRRFTVKGFIEQGSTTTPFDMTVLNESSRFDLVIRVIERLAEKQGKDVMSTEYAPLMQEYQAKLKEHASYVWSTGRTCQKSKTGCGRASEHGLR